MLEFQYTIKDPIGLHARPAGLLVKKIKDTKCNISIENEQGKRADAKKVFSIMGLGVKNGETVKVTVDGDNEAEVFEILCSFFEENI